MTTSAQPENEGAGQVCTPQSFLRGLCLLTKSFVKDSAVALALVALLMLLLTISSIPAVSNYQFGVNDFALASVVTFILSLVCGTLAYFLKSYRYEFLLATLFTAMFHMLFTTLMTQFAPLNVFHGENWWQAAPLLLKAAVLPMYVTRVLLAIALSLALAIGLVASMWLGVFNFPKAIRAAARYICRAGQGR
jgi:hypothetical protein